jgi:hypothetical protein
VVLAPYDKAPQSALRGIVVEGYNGILKHHGQSLPMRQYVGDGFAEVAPPQTVLRQRPQADLFEQRLHFLLPQLPRRAALRLAQEAGKAVAHCCMMVRESGPRGG